jgi:hypothetical protein
MSLPTQLSIDNSQVPAPTTSALGGVQAVSPVAHEWIDSINSSGVPHSSQPAFTDVSGQIAGGQLPSTGLSVTITTAKLTTLGSNGSQTFTNGILTAETAAT